MKKRNYFIIALILFILIGLFWGATPERIRIDGFKGEVLDLLFITDTKYSEHYSHSNFNRIKLDMSEQEVFEILGLPLRRWNPYQHTKFQDKAHFTGLQYSESTTDTNYRLRQVYLDNGVVAEIIGYLYVD